MTHGAGCTALLHALSGIPTKSLPYIERSSISVATYKAGNTEKDQRNLDETALSAQYSLDLVNCLEHLSNEKPSGPRR